MFWLTEDAWLGCSHGSGKVQIAPSQTLVTIEGRRVLVDNDPQSKSVIGCALAPPMKPCMTTLAVLNGYSGLIRINGKKVCLDPVTGLTDAAPPGTYHVRQPGQSLVSER